jgi:hypothetical protein
MSFDARHPNHPLPRLNPGFPPASLAPVKLPPSLLAKVGETFAVALSALQEALSALGPVTPAQQALLGAVLGEIDRLEYLGLRIQELARVLAGEAPVPPERIELARAAREAMAAWAPAAQAQGACLAVPNEPLALEVNGAVLGQLLDLALEHALHMGTRVEVSATRLGQPAHPTLSIMAHRSQAPLDGQGGEDLGELHWLLFAQLARAVGLVPQRIASDKAVTLTLFFPGADESAADAAALNPAWHPPTAFAPARQVLLIEPQEIVRVQAYRLMSEAGMRVDSAATLEQARGSLSDGKFDAVVTGIPVDDARVAALLEDARAARPGLHVVELVDDDSAFGLSVPGSGIPARVGRRDVARTLVAAVSQELGTGGPV